MFLPGGGEQRKGGVAVHLSIPSARRAAEVCADTSLAFKHVIILTDTPKGKQKPSLMYKQTMEGKPRNEGVNKPEIYYLYNYQYYAK